MKIGQKLKKSYNNFSKSSAFSQFCPNKKKNYKKIKINN